LTDPLRFSASSSFSSLGMLLHHPRLLGSGAGGAVFAVSTSTDMDPKTTTTTTTSRMLAIKISWLPSTESVENECHILKHHETFKVSGVEQCLGIQRYDADPRCVMILLEPVVEELTTVGSVDELDGMELQMHAVESMMRIMVRMLAAREVVTDVQTLISRDTGNVLLTDFTEARILPQDEVITLLDEASLYNFLAELMELIPESLSNVALDAVVKEVTEIEIKGGSVSNKVLVALKTRFNWE